MTGVDGAEFGSQITEVRKNEPLQIIAGKDRGFIRSNPQMMKDLLHRSFSAGDIADGFGEHTDAILGRITDLTTNFGRVEIKSDSYKKKVVEKFNSSTVVNSLGTFLDLVIKTEGLVDPADLPDNDNVDSSPLDELPLPRISIVFTRRLDNGLERYKFYLGRHNTTEFHRSFKEDNVNYEVTTELTPELAASFLSHYLPEIEEENGHSSLSSGSVLIPHEGDKISNFLDDVRTVRSRGAKTSAIEKRDQEKREKYGQESVLYLPEEFFTERNRDGVFFSYDYPQSIIPEDIVEHPQMEERIRRIADDLHIDVDDKLIVDMQAILVGLPVGSSRIGYLIEKNDGSITPAQSQRVPTIIFDKAAKYLLLHPQQLVDSLENYRKMSEEIGKEPADETAITYGIMAGLIDGYDAREFFGDLSETLYTKKDMKSPSVQEAIDKSYESFVQLGRVLKEEVYTADEIALVVPDM